VVQFHTDSSDATTCRSYQDASVFAPQISQDIVRSQLHKIQHLLNESDWTRLLVVWERRLIRLHLPAIFSLFGSNRSAHAAVAVAIVRLKVDCAPS
jgi:hypothetical protein